ncbi:MAG: Ig-like domain-containing protein [Eubacteriales bacterium]
MKTIKRKILSLALACLMIISCTSTVVFAQSGPVGVTYQAHVQDIGWQDTVSAGIAGTVGRSYRAEAFRISLSNAPSGAGITYQTHVQDIGWMPSVSDGAVTGTTGRSLRTEAIKISLVNMPGYSVEYRVHVQDTGWMAWVKDGAQAGTTGKSLRMEALEIRIVSLPVSAVSVSPTTMLLTAGGATGTISANIEFSNATNKNMTWSSSNTAVATVSGGVVTPIAAGTTNITVTTEDGGKTATCAVTVTEPVRAVSVSPTTMSLTAGGATGTISANIESSNATNKNVTWSSSNTAVATVSGGVVTPIAAGTADITVTTEDGGKTAICVVTVTVPVSNINIKGAGDADTVVNGSTLLMSAAISPSNATNKAITWSIINGTGSATIDESGLLTATVIGTVTVKARAKDGSSIQGMKEITITSADIIAPTATAAQDASAKTITYTFSEPMQLIDQATGAVTPVTPALLGIYAIDPATGNYANVKVGTIVTATLADNVLTVTYSGSLVNQADTSYVVDAWGYNITDLSGNKIVKDKSQIFTVTGADTIAPTATAVQDASAKTITYTFSEPMQLIDQATGAVTPVTPALLGIYAIDPATGNYANVKVGTIVTATLADNVLTVTYSGSLVNQADTSYVVDAWGYNITDLSGNKIVKDESQIFTVTGADTIAPK